MDTFSYYIEAQSRYFKIFCERRESSTLPRLCLADYGLERPREMDVAALPFCMYADDYLREIRNVITIFGTTIHRLEAWTDVLENTPENLLPWLLEEAVHPVATAALLTPYVIHERIIYCMAMLLHYSAPLSDPKSPRTVDEKNINKGQLQKKKGLFRIVADKLGVNLSNLLNSVDQINSSPVRELRNRFTHRLPPHLEYGLVTGLHRAQSGDRVGFSFGGEQPVPIADLIPTLTAEHARDVDAYKAFHATTADINELWSEYSRQG